MEMTSTVTQEFRSINGVGAEPSDTLELLSEGLWIVTVHFTDYEPPEVGAIPTVNLSCVLNGVNDCGSAGWSGRSWTRVYVSADRGVADDVGHWMGRVCARRGGGADRRPPRRGELVGGVRAPRRASA